MSDNKNNVDYEDTNKDNQKKNAGGQTGPVAGGADNTRGENKPSTKGNSDHANNTTTTRGADSTDKEFRNDQPNASTLKTHKSNVDIEDQKK